MTDANANDLDLDNASGGQLRQLLEGALKREKEATARANSLEAGALIATKGLKYVTAEELANVPTGEVEAKATALETARAAEREALLKSVLAEYGVTADDVPAGLQELLGRGQHDNTAALSRLNGMTALGGQAPPHVDTRALNPVDRMEAYFHKTGKSA